LRTPPGTSFPRRDFGFIKFFFDELDYRQHYPGNTPAIKARLSFDYKKFDHMELHLLKPGGQYGYSGDFPWFPDNYLPGDGFDWGGIGRNIHFLRAP